MGGGFPRNSQIHSLDSGDLVATEEASACSLATLVEYDLGLWDLVFFCLSESGSNPSSVLEESVLRGSRPAAAATLAAEAALAEATDEAAMVSRFMDRD